MQVIVYAIPEKGFWRAGQFWPKEGRTIDTEELGDAWDRVAAEPMLKVVPAGKDGAPAVDRSILIAETIATLPAEDFGADGVPNVKTVMAALPEGAERVSAAERDAALAHLRDRGWQPPAPAD